MNLEQVAKRAGVSTATVSRVLNNQELVKGKTRARVQKAIEELRYHPNLHARTLAGGKSKTIGVIVSNMENPFFFDIYQAVESDAHARGYEVLVANTDYRSEQLVASIRLMIGRRVAGLAAIVSEMDSALIEELTASSIPVVFYDVGAPRRNITNIRVNYRRGVEKVMHYLHGMGHRKLGFVGHHAKLGPINERMKTVLDLVAKDRTGVEVQTATDSDTLEGGRQATHALLSTGYEPHGDHLRERHHGRRSVAGAARTRAPCSGRCFGHRLRQHQAIRVLPSPFDHGPYPSRSHRPHRLPVPDSPGPQTG